MIYQDPYESLDPRFRVSQTVEEPMLVHGIGRSSADRRDLIIKALEQAGLSPADAFLDRYPHELSGGQRQRVAIAAALVLGPDLLLADEPVSMLDVSVRAGVLALLDGLRRTADMGILMITHDLSTAAHFADKIAVMYLGRIVEYGAASDVVRDPQHPYTKALLSVVPKRDPRDRSVPQILTGETPDPVDVPTGCRFHPRCPIAVERCRTQDPILRLYLLAAIGPPGAHNLAGQRQASHRSRRASRRFAPAGAGRVQLRWMYDHDFAQFRAYLAAERAHYDAATASLAGLTDELFAEAVARTPAAAEDSVAWTLRGYRYWHRTPRS